MRIQWYKTKELDYYKQLLNWKTKSGTQYILNKFYLEINAEGVTTICFQNASKNLKLLSFKGDKLLYKDLNAVLSLLPLQQLVFSEVIKKHFTANINI